MRRKREPSNTPQNLPSELLDQLFNLAFTSTNEKLRLKLLNKKYYQQVMQFFLCDETKPRHTLLENLANKDTVFPMPLDAIRNAIIQPSVDFDDRAHGLAAIAVNSGINLTVDDKVLDSLIAKIHGLVFIIEKERKDIAYLQMSVDLKLIAKHLTQEQIRKIQEVLIKTSPVLLKDPTRSYNYIWQSTIMRIFRPLINPGSNYILPEIDQELALYRQEFCLEALYKCAPYLSKSEVHDDITRLLDEANSEPSFLFTFWMKHLILLAEYLDDEQIDRLLKICIRLAKKDPSILWDSLKSKVLLSVAPFLEEKHIPLIAKLYNELPKNMDSTDPRKMTNSLFYNLAKKIKASIAVPYLKIFTNENVSHIPFLSIMILSYLQAAIPNEQRKGFVPYICSESNSTIYCVKSMAQDLIFHFLPYLSQDQLAQQQERSIGYNDNVNPCIKTPIYKSLTNSPSLLQLLGNPRSASESDDKSINADTLEILANLDLLESDEEFRKSKSIQNCVMNLLSYQLVTGIITPKQIKEAPVLKGNEMLQHFVNSYELVEKVTYNNNRLFKSQATDNAMELKTKNQLHQGAVDNLLQQ